MGWKDAPVVEESNAPAWKAAPAVEPVPKPAKVKPEPFKGTSTARDIVAGYGGGLYGAGLGAAQLGVEGFRALTPERFEGPLDRAATALREKESERRMVMDQLKEKHGDKGIANPISWAETAGEMAPYAAGGGLSVGRAVTSKLPVSYLQTAAEGALIGGATGAAAPLTEDESRLLSTGVGAVGGAVLGPVTRAGIEGAQASFKYGRGKVISWQEQRAVRKADPEAARLLQTPWRHVETDLRKVAPRKPSDIQSPQALAREIKNDQSAVQTIAKLRDDIELTRDGVTVKGELPKNLDEALQATSQSSAKIASWIDEISTAAGTQGVKVPVRDVVSTLSTVINSDKYLPSQVATANTYLERMLRVEQKGGMSVSDALGFMTNLNNDIRAIYTGKNVAGDAPEVLGLVASKVRESLNKTLESTEGGAQFGALRAELGKLLNLEKRLLRTVEKEANKDSKVSTNAFEIIGIEQLIHGAPVKAMSTLATNKVIRYLNSPNRAVRRIFRTADYMVGKDRMKAPQIPQATPPTTFFDPAIGARTAIRPGGGPRTDTGASTGAPFRPAETFDPTVGARVPTRPDLRPRTDTGASTGAPYAPLDYFDPAVGARTSRKP